MKKEDIGEIGFEVTLETDINKLIKNTDRELSYFVLDEFKKEILKVQRFLKKIPKKEFKKHIENMKEDFICFEGKTDSEIPPHTIERTAAVVFWRQFDYLFYEMKEFVIHGKEQNKFNQELVNEIYKTAIASYSKKLLNEYHIYSNVRNFDDITAIIRNTFSKKAADVIKKQLDKQMKNTNDRKRGGQLTADSWKKEKNKLFDIWKTFSKEQQKSNKKSLDLLSKETKLSYRKLEEYLRHWRKI